VAIRGGDEEEMADVDEDKEAPPDGKDAMTSGTETAPRTESDTETVTETGALATIDESFTVQLRKVIRMDHCGAGDGSQTQGGRSVLARATERKSRDGDQPFGI